MTEKKKQWAFAADVRVAGPDTLCGHCTCGWYGPERDDGIDADKDIQEHLASDAHWPTA